MQAHTSSSGRQQKKKKTSVGACFFFSVLYPLNLQICQKLIHSPLDLQQVSVITNDQLNTIPSDEHKLWPLLCGARAASSSRLSGSCV